MSAQTETQDAETNADGPLLDLTDAGVKKFIRQAKTRGYVTMEELNKVLPSEEVTPDQIEDILAMLSEMGVNVVEAEEDAAEATGTDVAAAAETSVAEAPAKAAYDRTDDPVRMYLREMGSVELLSREGEIAIAKRIEAGRDAMISGLCESALTFEAIMVWREELANNRILLREVIDLDATYGILNPSSLPHNQPAPAQPTGEPDGDGEEDDDEDFDDGGAMSISALEAELRDGVMEVLDAVAADFGAFRKLQDKLVETRLRGEALSTSPFRRASTSLSCSLRKPPKSEAMASSTSMTPSRSSASSAEIDMPPPSSKSSSSSSSDSGLSSAAGLSSASSSSPSGWAAPGRDEGFSTP